MHKFLRKKLIIYLLWYPSAGLACSWQVVRALLPQMGNCVVERLGRVVVGEGGPRKGLSMRNCPLPRTSALQMLLLFAYEVQRPTLPRLESVRFLRKNKISSSNPAGDFFFFRPGLVCIGHTKRIIKLTKPNNDFSPKIIPLPPSSLCYLHRGPRDDKSRNARRLAREPWDPRPIQPRSRVSVARSPDGVQASKLRQAPRRVRLAQRHRGKD